MGPAACVAGLALLAAVRCGSSAEPAARAHGKGRNRAAVPEWRMPGPMPVPERLRMLAANQDDLFIWFRLPSMMEGLKAQAGKAASPVEQASALLRLGISHIEMGQNEEGLQALSGALAAAKSAGASSDMQRGIRFWIGMAHIRQGEQDNCLSMHGPDACLFPIRGGGIHRNQAGSRAAIADFEGLLREQPDNMGHRWLLNLCYQTVGEYPDKVPKEFLIPPAVFAAEADIGRFPNVAGERGVSELRLSGGAALEDFDGDGDLDLLVSSSGVADPMHLFLNDGAGQFTPAGPAAGLEEERGGLNFTTADYDNDGDVDVFLLRGGWMGVRGRHPNSLLRNDGHGVFTDVTVEAGILSFHPTQTASWADFDGDGWLDVFIGNESQNDHEEPCELYRNRGDGTFEEMAERVGLAHKGWVKAAVWGDVDNDGRPDLYVSQAVSPNILFHNDGPAGPDGAWRFTDVTAKAGVAEPTFSFPAVFFDYDNDGWLDLFVTSRLRDDVPTEPAPGGAAGGRAPRGQDKIDSSPALMPFLADLLGQEQHLHVPPCLYRNNHDGTFTDVARAAHIAHPMLGMGLNVGDLNNDGWMDVAVGTGNPALSTLVPNMLFLNDGGKQFRNITASAGFGHLQKGHGIAFGDIDGDGDQDVFEELGAVWPGDRARSALFLNPGHGAHWVTLRLAGTTSNRLGTGARIAVTVSTPHGERTIHALAGTGGSFGCSSHQQEIGLGDAAAIRRIEIRWPGPAAEPQVLQGVPMDRVLLVRQGAARVEASLR